MTSNLIFECFKRLFVIPYGLSCEEWFPNGKNSVRVKLTNNEVLIFHYESDDNWQIETMRSFLNKLKEVKNSKRIM